MHSKVRMERRKDNEEKLLATLFMVCFIFVLPLRRYMHTPITGM